MIFRLSVILFLVCLCHTQGATLTGLIIDSETREPLFGVAVIWKNAPVAFSDDEGRFTLPLDNVKPQDTIFFKHLCYHDLVIVYNRLRMDSTVRMENRLFSLAEVSVQPVDYQKLIKSIAVKYEKTAPAQPWWTKIHQAQTLTYRGEVSGFVEYTGNMLCMGREITNPFIVNQWFPEHIRRIKENPLVTLFLDDEIRVRSSENLIIQLWTYYRFFDVTHPLGKCHKSYEIRVDSAFNQGGKDYWALSYRQKERIIIERWILSGYSGQMWIEKNTNTLVRLTGSGNNGGNEAIQADIVYGKFDHHVVPQEINISVIQNRTIRGQRRLQDKILYESRISFLEADVRQKKNYKGDYKSFFPEIVVTELPYEHDYWLSFPLKVKMDFSESANMQIFSDPDDATLKESQIWTQKLHQQMKSEIKQLTWKSIKPI